MTIYVDKPVPTVLKLVQYIYFYVLREPIMCIPSDRSSEYESGQLKNHIVIFENN